MEADASEEDAVRAYRMLAKWVEIHFVIAPDFEKLERAAALEVSV